MTEPTQVPAPVPAPAAPDEPGAVATEPAAEAPPVDHKGLLHELAAHIRDVAASPAKDVRELLAWLAGKGL